MVNSSLNDREQNSISTKVSPSQNVIYWAVRLMQLRTGGV